jgi:predicted DNA-binding transcriptional regulator YafY
MAAPGIAARLDRLEELKGLLKAREHVTAAELADELGVSLRTVSRDLSVLRRHGTPIESDRGRGGGLRLERHWSQGRLHLRAEEAVDLLLSLALAEAMGLPLFPFTLGRIRRKIAAAFARTFEADIRALRRRVIVAGPASPAVLAGYRKPAAAVLEAIATAFFNLKCIEIDYADRHGTGTRRKVEPQFLLLSPPVWYLLAHDRLRGAIRHFRIDRIAACARLEERFRPAPLKPYLDFAESEFRFI